MYRHSIIRKGALFFIITLQVCFMGCISEYEHSGIQHLSNLLVVEGTITNEMTTIRLSRSVALTEDVSDASVVNNATVFIEIENGGKINPNGTPVNGQYHFLTHELDMNARYRLYISLDGEEYASDFLQPLNTPEIGSIDLYKASLGKPVELQVSTQNSEEGSPYYMWSYEEIWEHSSPLMADAVQIPWTGEPEQIFTYNLYTPYYYCWNYGHSKSLLIGSAAKLSSNKIENLTLDKFDASSNRFSILYYVKLKQNSLRKEAYNYFSNQKLNSESTGDIFGPIPSEMKGNITCLTNPDIPVIGYIEVSTTKWTEEFFPYPKIYERPFSSCKSYSSESLADAGLSRHEVTILSYNPEDPGATLFTFRECVDCRTQGGFHDRKPSFWPNNHN